MRTYVIYYYKEINDDCVDCEMELKANSVRDVLDKFEQIVKVYKRISSIEELSNEKPFKERVTTNETSYEYHGFCGNLEPGTLFIFIVVAVILFLMVLGGAIIHNIYLQ